MAAPAMLITPFLFFLDVQRIAAQGHLALLQHRVNLSTVETVGKGAKGRVHASIVVTANGKKGNECEKAVAYAKKTGIKKHPTSFRGLTEESPEDEVRSFYVQKHMFSCDKDWNECTTKANWAKWIDIKENPSKYPDLSVSSSIEKFEKFFAKKKKYGCEEIAKLQEDEDDEPQKKEDAEVTSRVSQDEDAEERSNDKECVDLTGKYLEEKLNNDVVVTQDNCDVKAQVVFENDKNLEWTGHVKGSILSIDGFESTAKRGSKGDIEFEDGGRWKKVEMPSKTKAEVEDLACTTFAGKYYDKRDNELHVSQDGCDVTVEKGRHGKDGKMEGKANGAKLSITGFQSTGSLSDDGDIEFGDGGRWQKSSESKADASEATSSPPSHDDNPAACADLHGKYMEEKSNVEIHVVQDDCDVTVEVMYPDNKATWKGEIKDGVLAIVGFDATAKRGPTGDVVFADGGRWLWAGEPKGEDDVSAEDLSADLVIVHHLDDGSVVSEQRIRSDDRETNAREDVVELETMPIGIMEPLTHAGYRNVAAEHDEDQMSTFASRILAASGHESLSQVALEAVGANHSGRRSKWSLDDLLADLGARGWVVSKAGAGTKDDKGKLVIKTCESQRQSLSGEKEWMSEKEFCRTFDCSKEDDWIMKGRILLRFDPECPTKTQYRIHDAYMKGCSTVDIEDSWYKWQDFCLKLAQSGQSCVKAEYKQRTEHGCPIQFYKLTDA